MKFDFFFSFGLRALLHGVDSQKTTCNATQIQHPKWVVLVLPNSQFTMIDSNHTKTLPSNNLCTFTDSTIMKIMDGSGTNANYSEKCEQKRARVKQTL